LRSRSDGELVVDIWAGWMDPDRKRPWRRDTLVHVYSVGKAMATLCMLVLVERGQVELDAPVARYWLTGVGSTRTVDSHARRVRGKLVPFRRRWVINVWGERR
jgi:CubicO group peptidase (beta-lactamase class C family)